ncbi:MAG TPA: DUF6531 domain-containing protein [Acidimicrobiales bacterium]|nr:DUF6531 domain-containing protein [Acidimicrobiales bacterium]
MAYDSANNLLIGDHNNHRVRKNGVISTVAGNGIAGFAGDGGQAVSARLNLPGGIVLDGAGNLYIADNGNNRVRKVAANGIITTLAGTGVAGSSGDGGPATSAQLSGPTGVEIDRAGNLFVSEYGGHRIRKLAANGIITTVAGNGIAGFAGDGGAATSAQLFSPAGIELDYPGNLYIADFNNGRVRKVATNGVITTVAGNGTAGFGGDGGPATSASVWSPNGIAIDRAGNLFIADTRNQRVRKVDTAGTITTVAGNGNFGFSGDGGPATAASFRYPDDVAIDGAGNVAIADQDNHRVRRVEAIAVGGPIGGAIGAKEVLGGENPCEPCVTDDATDYPITTSTGNFWHTFDHLATPGRGLPISLSHTYNSLSAGTDGPLGYGWQFNYAMSLTVVASTVTVRQENGSEVQFAESATSYVAPPRVIATLVKNADASFTFTRGAREVYKFNPVGQLVSQQDLNGYVTSLAYNASNQLSSVTEPAGRTLNFAYTGARITGVSVPASPARSVAFSYDGAGNLSDITDVAAGNWHFTYDGAHRMLTMRSPRQAGLVTNHYDGSGRVDWQSDPLGRTTYFDYTTIAGATKVTDPRGNVTVDTYAYGQLVSKTTGYGTAQAATWNFVYDPATAEMSSATDPNARTTTTYHDGFGNPVRTTDPLGRTTTAIYNALNQPSPSPMPRRRRQRSCTIPPAI